MLNAIAIAATPQESGVVTFLCDGLASGYLEFHDDLRKVRENRTVGGGEQRL